MNLPFQAALDLIHFRVFLFSMVLFFTGYTLAPYVYFKEIRFLLVYPLWIAKKLDRLASKKWNPLLLFLFIFFMNLASLFVDLISGKVPGLPVVFTIWTGLNIGVITYHTLQGKFYFTALLNPVALFELPAAFIAFTLALEYNCVVINCTLIKNLPVAFSAYLNSFFLTVVPLLFLAGVIETFAIKIAQKIESAEAESKDEKNSSED